MTQHALQPARAPFDEILSASYAWIDDYTAAQELLDKISDLKAQISELNRLRPNVDITSLKRTLEVYHERRIRALSRLIEVNVSGDWTAPLFDPGIRQNIIPPEISEQELIEAAKLVPAGQIDPGKRDKQIAKIRADIDKHKAELEDLAAKTQRYFMRDGSGIMCDIRELYVTHWKAMQQRCNAPCGPSGRTLKDHDDATRQAWQRLGLSYHINQATDRPPAGEEE